jgi:hypothetical protein
MERGSTVPSANPKRVASDPAAHDHLERNDLDLAHELLAHIEAPHEMRRNPGFAEPRHQILRDPVVEDPFADDCAFLLIVEGRSVVLEVLHQRARLGPLIQNLRLAFIDAALAGHGRFSRCQDSR